MEVFSLVLTTPQHRGKKVLKSLPKCRVHRVAFKAWSCGWVELGFEGGKSASACPCPLTAVLTLHGPQAWLSAGEAALFPQLLESKIGQLFSTAVKRGKRVTQQKGSFSLMACT